ncbi:hypothetical protein KP509_38G053100 [Ceratopteris richardii]|uniref:Pentatricopeptide repeat-containing protein n=1 Tax=Ceratopteris richardii TaxID=49495 RepID=A0A8T2Q4Y7_CERRI|nr:hypothetical protein KP509_38G053100 [Ceratopteris richardii]
MYFDKMQIADLSPDSVTYACILKACASTESIQKGEQIYLKVSKLGFLEKDVVLGTAVVDMYAKRNDLTKAQQVLQSLSHRYVTSWNALIGGYCQAGHIEHAFIYLEHMKAEGLSLDSVTYACILKACASTESIQKGEQIYLKVSKLGFLEKDVVLGIAVVDMYVKRNDITKAQQVLQSLSHHYVTSWNALIGGYCQAGHIEHAFIHLKHMKAEGLSLDSVTYACILKACASTKSIQKGEQIYLKVSKLGFLEKDVVLGIAVVDMYAKRNDLTKAQQVLQSLSHHYVTSWNALIGGYCQAGHIEHAFIHLEHMKAEGLSPNSLTYACILKACASTESIQKGEQIYLKVSKLGFLEKDVVLGIAVVDMYAKRNDLTKAKQVLQSLSHRYVTSWNALIGGYFQAGHIEHAFIHLEHMKAEGLSLGAYAFVGILRTCAKNKDLSRGIRIHHDLQRQGLVGKCLDALSSMYARCGAISKARELLDTYKSRNAYSWIVVTTKCA